MALGPFLLVHTHPDAIIIRLVHHKNGPWAILDSYMHARMSLGPFLLFLCMPEYP